MSIPNGTSLKVCRSTGQNSSRNSVHGFTAIHDSLGNGGELPEDTISHQISDQNGQNQWAPLRGAMVNSSFIVRLVTGHRFGRSLVGD